jgi:Holliday junction resolvase RusA-like endonuclease
MHDHDAINFVIPGIPFGKQRPRFTRGGIAYTPAKTANYENLVKVMAAEAMKGRSLLTCPVRLIIKAYFEVPKSFSRKNRIGAFSGWIKPTKKPDLSNIAKGIEDAMNKVVYQDDAQIVGLFCTKQYGETPSVDVSILPLETL